MLAKMQLLLLLSKNPTIGKISQSDVSQQWPSLNHESGSSYLPGDNELSPAAAPPSHVHWGHLRNWMHRKQETGNRNVILQNAAG